MDSALGFEVVLLAVVALILILPFLRTGEQVELFVSSFFLAASSSLVTTHAGFGPLDSAEPLSMVCSKGQTSPRAFVQSVL